MSINPSALLRLRVEQAVSVFGGQRAAARALSIPRTTIQDILKFDRTRRALTLERVGGAIQRAAVTEPALRTTRIQRDRTTMDWIEPGSERALITLRPPTGATHFMLTLKDADYPRGFRASGWLELRSFSPQDVLERTGLDPEQVAGIVWNVR